MTDSRTQFFFRRQIHGPAPGAAPDLGGLARPGYVLPDKSPERRRLDGIDRRLVRLGHEIEGVGLVMRGRPALQIAVELHAPHRFPVARMSMLRSVSAAAFSHEKARARARLRSDERCHASRS